MTRLSSTLVVSACGFFDVVKRRITPQASGRTRPSSLRYARFITLAFFQ
jgi:hypothetical protein